MIKLRELIVKNIFKETVDSKIYLSKAFPYVIDNIYNQLYLQNNSLVDITPLDALKLIDEKFEKLSPEDQGVEVQKNWNKYMKK